VQRCCCLQRSGGTCWLPASSQLQRCVDLQYLKRLLAVRLLALGVTSGLVGEDA
jgi:hypothetical protein